MDDVSDSEAPKRGMSASHMRAFTCKDCQREVEGIRAEIAVLEARGASGNQLKKLRGALRARLEKATYNENWAQNLLERGGSRSDRCKDHRQKHRVNIQGLAVAYIDLKTVGEVSDRENPTGPLGGLGPLPTLHDEVEGTSYDLQAVRVGMTDGHVAEMIEKLREKRVLILKAGTGTGKSTFAPYRLMDPPLSTVTQMPPGAPFAKLTDLGPIIVTEPRVQAAVGVASFVGGVMSGAGGVGPGYPVGYQVSGDRNHDDACELIYVTDGTMINWLREGRLSKIGTIIVDEAHERSTNIDFILGYLKRELPRYPHLRVIVTSATFNTDFYLEYFGGPENANVMDVPPEKNFGYGMPFFPNLDTPEDGEDDIFERWTDPALPLISQNPRSTAAFIETHWKGQFAEPLHFPDDVTTEAAEEGTEGEDVWATTQALADLRFTGKIPIEEWRERMPGEMAKFVIQLARGLDDAGIFGDILGFLPTKRTIEPVCEEIERELGRTYKDQVFPLISSLPKDRQKRALAKRRKGDPRKIVISTNLAETSLTVEGVRFVVDSGIIAQSEWDPELAMGSIPTKPHSQSGVRQRWGRVGRKAPGWVFPLYTKGQFLELAEDTPPGSTRDNLEALVMTAKMGGIDDVLSFDWPASFQPSTVQLDENATQAREIFVRELLRADSALRAGGAVDNDGHPTSFGKELVRFQGLGSTASALAIMYADRLACVPEVAMVIALLEGSRLIGQRGLLLDDFDWPDEWRLEAAERHRGLAALCDDEAELVLLIAAAWEGADPSVPPWVDSPLRQDWARNWWVSHAGLLEAAKKRQEVLGALSPSMKEEVKRFIEPALIDRVRGVLTRSMAANIFTKSPDGGYQRLDTPRAVMTDEEPHLKTDSARHGAPAQDGPAPRTASTRAFALEADSLVRPQTEHVVALRRRESKFDNRISSLVAAQEWAMSQPNEQQPSSAVDAMRMVIAASKYAPADVVKSHALRYIESWPVGQRVQLELETVDGVAKVRAATSAPVPPFPRPKTREERGDDSQRRRKARSGIRNGLHGDEDSGTNEDVRTDLRLDVRHGYDDESRDQAELFAADQETGTVQACGQCFPCRDDRPDDCEQQTGPTEPGRREDLVAAWFTKASAGVDVSTPRVVVDLEYPVESDGWYEVIGYSRDETGLVVKLRPDWRKGQVSNAGQHPDLKAGDPVDVRVGRPLSHHGGSLRAFDRLDGKGRFILAEARSRYDDDQVRRREIAVSLNRGNSLLLDSLAPGAVIKATAVPARAEGTLTITLLELLHQHWSKAQAGRGASNEIVDKARRNQFSERVYTAVVESPPNVNGYATARLLHQDSDIGIVHIFDFNVKPKEPRDEENPSDPGDIPVEIDSAQLAPGEPIMLKLRSDRTKLDVSGLSVDKLRLIESHQAGQLTIEGLPNNYEANTRSRNLPLAPIQPAVHSLSPVDNGSSHDEDNDDNQLSPPGTFVIAKTEKPLSRSAATSLVGLTDEPDWPNEVWSFWARTHHLRVDDRTPFIPGTLTEPFEVRAAVRIEEATPLAQQQSRRAAFAAEHPVFSVIDCVVKSLSNRGVFVEVDTELEGFIPIAELSWANRVRHPDQVVTVGERLRALVQEIPVLPAALRLSLKALTPDPFEAFKSRNPPGARVVGSINGSVQHALFIDLGAEVDGSIHVSELDHVRVSSAENFAEFGASIEAEVLCFDEKGRKVNLSRKKTLPPPYDAYRARHSIGDMVRATVRSATRSHVYVSHSNGATGVIYVRNLGSSDVGDASTAFVIGQEVISEIIAFNDSKRQVELSIAALRYREYKARHTRGDKVESTVDRVSSTHVNVRHSNGAAGVIHVGQLAGNIHDASMAYSPGDRVMAKIESFNDEKMQVELTVRAVLYDEYRARHKVGDRVEGQVVRATRTHVYLAHSNGATGAIFHRNLAHGGVEDATKAVRDGDKLTAQIINFKDDLFQVELSIKALMPEPYPAFKAANSIGTPVTAIVSGFNDSFAYVKLPGGVDGSIHVSQISAVRVNKPTDALSEGQELAAVVVGFDDQRKKVQLSLRQTSTSNGQPARAQPSRLPTSPSRLTSLPSARAAPKLQPRSVEAEADTVAIAVEKACRQLDVSRSSVTYKVLDEGEPRRLFRSARPARVRVTTT